ncbi:unnamed protein product, partial [Pleuronectes platessa]
MLSTRRPVHIHHRRTVGGRAGKKQMEVRRTREIVGEAQLIPCERAQGTWAPERGSRPCSSDVTLDITKQKGYQAPAHENREKAASVVRDLDWRREQTPMSIPAITSTQFPRRTERKNATGLSRGPAFMAVAVLITAMSTGTARAPPQREGIPGVFGRPNLGAEDTSFPGAAGREGHEMRRIIPRCPGEKSAVYQERPPATDEPSVSAVQ